MNESLSRKDLRIPVLTILRTKFFQVKNGKKKRIISHKQSTYLAYFSHYSANFSFFFSVMFFTSVIRCFSLFYFNFSLFAKKIIGSKGTSAVCYSAVNTSIMRIFASLTSQSMFCNCFILINMTMLNQFIADHLTSLPEESRITVVYNCSTLCNVGYLSYG